MPYLPLKFPNAAQHENEIALQAYMHFPGFSKPPREFGAAKDHSRREKRTIPKVEQMRNTYVHFLSSQSLLVPQQECFWWHDDDGYSRPKPPDLSKIAYWDLMRLRLGRDFCELCDINAKAYTKEEMKNIYTLGITVDSIRFYQNAFLASCCFQYYASLISRGVSPLSISFSSCKRFIIERVAPNLAGVFVDGRSYESRSAQSGSSKGSDRLGSNVPTASWTSALNALEEAVAQIAPVLHLWCALFLTEQLISQLAPSNVERPLAKWERGPENLYIGRLFDRSEHYNRFTHIVSVDLLHRAYEYQKIMIEAFERTQHADGRPMGEPWLAPDRMWLIPDRFMTSTFRRSNYQVREPLVHPWLTPE